MDSNNAVRYTTVAKEASAEFTERKSVFIGHACPVKTDAEAMEYVKKIKEQYPEYSIHDFRVAFGETHNNVIFDVVVPQNCNISDSEIHKQLEKLVKEIDEKNNAVIQIDKCYI